eukprot:g20891.t1
MSQADPGTPDDEAEALRLALTCVPTIWQATGASVCEVLLCQNTRIQELQDLTFFFAQTWRSFVGCCGVGVCETNCRTSGQLCTCLEWHSWRMCRTFGA